MTNPQMVPDLSQSIIAAGESSQAFQQRAAMLAGAHPWMDPTINASLASSSTSDPQMMSIGDRLKSSIAAAWDGFSHPHDDPVLHKEDSTSLALHRYLTAAIGPLPITDADLGHMQGKLQEQGYGKGLTANGAWDAEWNQAYNTYVSDLKQKQLAGDKPGSISTGQAAHHWYDAILPTHVADAVLGFVKSMPGDLRDLVSNAAGRTEGWVSAVEHGDIKGTLTGGYLGNEQSQADAAAMRGLFERKLGFMTTEPPPSTDVSPYDWRKVAGDIGTIALIVPIAGEGSAAARAAKVDFGVGYSKEAAARGPGVVAKSLFGGRDARTVEAIKAMQDAGHVSRGGLFANAPLMRQLSPVVGRLADADGLYYRGRTLLAAPYRYPGVRVAGREFQRASIYGAAVRGVAAVAGPETSIGQHVAKEHTFDVANANLERITRSAFGGHFAVGLNTLAWVMHGPLGGAGSLSEHASERATTFVNAASDSIGSLGVHGAFQIALSPDMRKPLSVKALRDMFGSDERLFSAITERTANLAAADKVHELLNAEPGLKFGTSQYYDRAGELADQVWADPALHQEGIRNLLADPYRLINRIRIDAMHGLTNRTAREMVNDLHADDVTGALPDLKQLGLNMRTYQDAGDILTNDILRAGHGKFLTGGKGQGIIADAKDTFDYGLGAPDLARVGRPASLTRRTYVSQVGQLREQIANLLTRTETEIRQGMESAQAHEADTRRALAETDTADAEAVKHAKAAVAGASSRRSAAEKTLEQFTKTRGTPNFRELVRIAAPNAEFTGKLDPQIQRAADAYRRLHSLITQGEEPGRVLTIDGLLTRASDPDAAFTRVAGEARPVPREIGTGDWLQALLHNDEGTIGLGRADSLSRQQATNQVMAWSRDAERMKASADTESLTRLEEKIKDWMFGNFGFDQRKLGAFDGDVDRLLEVAESHANRLASEVFLAKDAPLELIQAQRKLEGLGYRMMVGSHIGHRYDGSLPSIGDINGHLTKTRRAAHWLGVNPDAVPTTTVGQAGRLAVQGQLFRLWQENPARFGPRTTPQTIMAVLDQAHEAKLSSAEKVAYAASRGITGGRAHRSGIDLIERQAIARGETITRAEAERRYERSLAEDLTWRDSPRSEIIRTLTSKGTFSNGVEWAGVDKETANRMYRAMLRGFAERPRYMMGWQGMDGWARAGFGFGDKLATRHPNQDWLQAVANAPNRYVQLRNKLRFTLSPLYDARRIVKNDYKMGLQGVQWRANPLGHMLKTGTWKEDHALLDRIMGLDNRAGYDDADRYLHSQSVWGMNPRHFMAYFTGEKARQGLSDEELRLAVNQAFGYGNIQKGGRSALERTMNTAFFPFSFEKTLLRNTSLYMLDHPAQALTIALALDEYGKANQHDEIHHWLSDHLPLVTYMNDKLNAFTHGISPGEKYGINAPLLNMFMPQNWGGGHTTKNLERFLPVFHDFGQVWHATREQSQIGFNAAANTADYAVSLGKPRGPFDPYRPTITPEAQIRAAVRKKTQFVTTLGSVIAYNNSRSLDSEKVVFPSGQGLPAGLEGKPINKTTIGELMRVWYPAYDPSESRAYAEKQAAKADRSIAKITDPQERADYTLFKQKADQYAQYVNGDQFNPAQVATVDSAFRSTAIEMDATYPGFGAWYSRFYRWGFGPLERIEPLP